MEEYIKNKREAVEKQKYADKAKDEKKKVKAAKKGGRRKGTTGKR